MSGSACAKFEQKLAYHAAPALMGIKAACLFSVRSTEFDVTAHVAQFHARMGKQEDLQMRVLCQCKQRALLFLYSKTLLTRRLMDPERTSFLETFGYSRRMTLEQYLDMLSVRIAESDEFPHEIGIFLDYPTEDVIGFMQHGGAHCKLCGYWKVYGNAEKAQRTFAHYTKCRKFLCDQLQQGNDLYQALHNF
jgi:hypothetical protein